MLFRILHHTTARGHCGVADEKRLCYLLTYLLGGERTLGTNLPE